MKHLIGELASPAVEISTGPEPLAISDFRLNPEAVEHVLDQFTSSSNSLSSKDVKKVEIIGSMATTKAATSEIEESTYHVMPVVPSVIENEDEPSGDRLYPSLEVCNRRAVEYLHNIATYGSIKNPTEDEDTSGPISKLWRSRVAATSSSIANTLLIMEETKTVSTWLTKHVLASVGIRVCRYSNHLEEKSKAKSQDTKHQAALDDLAAANQVVISKEDL